MTPLLLVALSLISAAAGALVAWAWSKRRDPNLAIFAVVVASLALFLALAMIVSRP